MYGLELSGSLATAALHLPLAALVAVAVLATRRMTVLARRRGARPPEGPEVYGVGRYGAPLASAAAPVDAREAELGTLAARASRAEARGEEREALDLHLAVARKKQELGRLDEAADSLRRTIRLAARLGNKEAQARARLDLGDLARARGDLTTACEHWQIARGLFFELKQARELKEAETRMRDHGCPTDWVLNDF